MTKKLEFSEYYLKRNGKLLITNITYKNFGKRNRAFFICMCDCGTQTIIQADKFNRNQSCGCENIERIRLIGFENKKHGHAVDVSKGGDVSNTYRNWHKVKTTVYVGNKKGIHYACHEYDSKWETFEGFLEDMGIIDDDLYLSRINKNITWCKENCNLKKRKKYDN